MPGGRAGYTPQIATDDGGVIATDSNTGSAVTFDQNGNATGQLGGLPKQSWTVQSYISAGGQIAAVQAPLVKWGTSYEAMTAGNPSANGTSIGVAESAEERDLSNPGSGSGVNKIGPAVPSPTGVADAV